MNIENYKLVGLKVLKVFVKKICGDYLFSLSSDDESYLMKHPVSDDLNEIITGEKRMMPIITWYSSAF